MPEAGVSRRRRGPGLDNLATRSPELQIRDQICFMLDAQQVFSALAQEVETRQEQASGNSPLDTDRILQPAQKKKA